MIALFCALSVFASDYVAKTGFVELSPELSAIGVSATQAERRDGEAVFHEIRIASDGSRDRALVVRFLLPQDKPCDFMYTYYPRVPVPLTSRDQDYPAQRSWGNKEIGSLKLVSTVPLVGASSAGAEKGMALGVEMTCPVICRLGFDAAKNALYAECDIGLAPECPSAVIRLVSFPFAAEDGFRAAWERYMALQPEAFKVRVKEHGTWLAGVTADKVPDWQDFGFKFMEGAKLASDWDVDGDDRRGIYSFRYQSSSTWTINIPTNMPNDIASAKEMARRRAAAGDKMALAWEQCRFLGEDGEPTCKFFDIFWLRGVSWNLNAEPGLPYAMTPYIAKGNSKEDLDARYKGAFPQGCDGEFVDSANGFGVASFDHNRAHFAYMKDAPLCFAHESGRVGIPNVASTRAYIRTLSQDLHARGRLMMANYCLGVHHFIVPYVDIIGKEMKSLDDKGEYVQPKDHEMIYFRMLTGKKPYCMFQNTNFNLLTYEMSERYIQRMLAYGILPSYFSPVNCGTSTRFFAHPTWREGVRPLYKKYFKTVKAVSEAGWEPVSRTLRSAKPDDVTVEQFGRPGSPKGCYLTVHNPSDKPAETTLLPAHGFKAAEEYADVVSGTKVSVGRPFEIPPYATWVLALSERN